MKKVALTLLVCVLLPIQHGVIAQQTRGLRIANDWCYPRVDDNGWTSVDICEVQVFDGGGETYIGGHSPAWSPDGLRIAYLAGGLYVYDRTTHTSAMLTDALSLSGPLSWSRDGAHLALLGSFEGSSGWELLVIDPDGSNLTRLTHGVGFRGTYAWSPGGNAIAFGGDDGGGQELYVMGANGSNPTRLTYGAGFSGAISWSPDGNKIAFDCGATVCAINPDGTNLVQLAAAMANASTAIFSPAGGDVAFLTGRFGSGELKVMRADGSIVGVAPGITATKPTWSADGRSLAFVQEGNWWTGGACNGDGSPCGRAPDSTYAVEADGGGLRLLAYGSNPAWFVPLPGQPAATFTTACTGSTCQFDATGSFDPDGTILSYEWKFGDGTTGSGPAPAHTYGHSSLNTYAAILIVTDADGQRDATRGHTVTLADTRPFAWFTATCTGLACAFDASASFDPDGIISSYAWNFGDAPNSMGDGRAPSYRYLAGGAYTVTLTVTYDASQTSTFSRMVTVVAPPPPAMHIGDLDGSSTAAQKWWTATVTIGLHTESHGGAAGVTVTGVWDDGAAGTCTTDGYGRCSMSRGATPPKMSSVGFTVTGATSSSFVFSQGANHDPDRDSNGTTIVIRRP